MGVGKVGGYSAAFTDAVPGFAARHGVAVDHSDPPRSGKGIGVAVSRHSIELLHPGRSQELKNPVYVSWGHIPYNLGSWVSGFETGVPSGYEVWIQPQGRIYLAGDHTSHIVGWQEGAALSAHRALNLIADRVAKT